MYCDSLNEGLMDRGHRSRPRFYFLSIANSIFLTKLKFNLLLELELKLELELRLELKLDLDLNCNSYFDN